MFERLTALQTAHDLAVHAAARQGVLANNIANADTPGFSRRDIQPFAEVFARGPESASMTVTRPGHVAIGALQAAIRPDTGAPAAPNGNSVSIETEMMRSAEARHQHDLALTVFRSLTAVVRSALGR
jgi:flagellar basal-body rod protein FlgB